MGTIPASENEFPSLLFAEGAAPATPAAGLVVCYAKADGLLYCKDDAGVETAYAAAATDLAAHLADAADAHDASAISVADAGAVFTGTDVEAVLAELQAAIAGGGIPATLLDAKGDLIAASAADTAARLAIGANGTVLTADSAEATGMKWSPTLGAWTSYTPTLTADSVNPTLGNGTLSGRYKLLDATTLAVQIIFVFGSTSAAGTGTWHFALPGGTTTGALNQVLAAHLNDANVGHRAGSAWVAGGGSVVTQIMAAGSSTQQIVTHNAPWTWATGDQIEISGILEVA